MNGTPSRRKNIRSGFSLLEATIATLMSTFVVTMAAGVVYDISRHMAANIVETQVALEARLAIESFRRDLSGSVRDYVLDETFEWRLVGTLIPTPTELRLCFDHDKDASADWADPDRVITYTLVGDRLRRHDAQTGVTVNIAHNIDDIEYVINGNELQIVIDFQIGNFTETYTFVTSDLL